MGAGARPPLRRMHVTDHNFTAQVLESDNPVLVDFTAAWCPPCRVMGPILDQLATDRDDLKIVKLDVDDNQATAVRYGVLSMPTFMLFRDGAPIQNLMARARRRRLESEARASARAGSRPAGEAPAVGVSNDSRWRGGWTRSAAPTTGPGRSSHDAGTTAIPRPPPHEEAHGRRIADLEQRQRAEPGRLSGGDDGGAERRSRLGEDERAAARRRARSPCRRVRRRPAPRRAAARRRFPDSSLPNGWRCIRPSPWEWRPP